ncbi:TetR/AcrR family transcriptional regulator [Williamsia sterculiae]|uniref:Transcriptional regulator, TetR family n=1 Tax=Williamsia sterculiae TaxID=1344003 RepID=A0A1N7FXK7_9NOCA|nr:TetR/AcrR family transcriptional regulator [Williamsia sterculiae]SIS05071.1 transcriptional regulator, TetR family [Williamsia sterculiae]
MFSEHVQSRVDQKEATRRRVLDAADSLFRSQGFAATTVRQIASKAEVSAGSVMAVGDKDALLVAIYDSWIAAVHRSRAETFGDMPSADLPDDVIALFEPFVDHFARDIELSREYAAVIVRGDHDTTIFRQLGLTLVGEVHQVLVRSGVDETSAGRRAAAIYLAYLGILMTVSNGAVSDESGRAQFRDVVSLITDHEELS